MKMYREWKEVIQQKLDLSMKGELEMDVNERDWKNCTAEHYLVSPIDMNRNEGNSRFRHRLNVEEQEVRLTLLLAHPHMDLHARDSRNESALEMAITRGNMKIA